MKAKLLRSDLGVGDTAYQRGEKYVLDNSVVPPNAKEVNGRKERVWKPGTVISHPKAYVLVRHGVAEPADDECRQRANVTQNQMAELQAAYDRLQEDGSYEHELTVQENAIPITEDEDDE